jgi:hypothetical protein
MFTRPNPKGEFEEEFTTFVPKESEIRIVTNKNRECAYYWVGMSFFPPRITIFEYFSFLGMAILFFRNFSPRDVQKIIILH